jgi:hypothetical protein
MTLGTGQTWKNLGYRFEEEFLVRDKGHSSDVTRRYNSRCLLHYWRDSNKIWKKWTF